MDKKKSVINSRQKSHRSKKRKCTRNVDHLFTKKLREYTRTRNHRDFSARTFVIMHYGTGNHVLTISINLRSMADVSFIISWCMLKNLFKGFPFQQH